MLVGLFIFKHNWCCWCWFCCRYGLLILKLGFNLIFLQNYIYKV